MEQEKLVGKVSHFFDQAMVAAIKLDSALSVGDTIRLKTKNDEVAETTITSMQADHKDIDTGRGGEEIAIKVSEKVKVGTEVYKVTQLPG
ncbi:hypothetical protein ACFLY5_01280 [Patescibacteria group bacterium]